MRWRSVPLVMAVSFLGLGSPVAASGPPVDEVGSDVKEIALALGADEDTVREEQALADDIAGLQEGLRKEQANWFGGLWVSHSPSLSVFVRIVPGSELDVLEYAPAKELQEVMQVLPADYSLAELLEIQQGLYGAVPYGIDFQSGISNELNRVVLTVSASDSMILEGWPAPGGVVVTEAGALPEPASIYGGLAISNGCTTGFSVVELVGGDQGVSTAGHCGNSVYFEGTYLPLQDEQWSNNTDAQWHTTPGLADPNKFYSGIDTRVVLNVYSWSEQYEGMSVCRYGRNGGYGCGQISDIYDDPPDACVPNSGNKWIVVDSAGVVVGDSGGPVFKNNGAYGTIACKSSSTFVYMAANRFQTIGVRVDAN